MSPQHKKRKLSEDESSTIGPDLEFDDDLMNFTDTEAAISAVIRSTQGSQLCKGALVHQLYAILPNKTDVDNEILHLRQSRGIKLLHFNPTGSVLAAESHFVMLSSDYTGDLRNKLDAVAKGSSLHGSLVRFIPFAVKYSDKLSILESELLSIGGRTGSDKGKEVNTNGESSFRQGTSSSSLFFVDAHFYSLF